MTQLLAVVLRVDAFVARSRPLWRWLGQAALVVLGVHLAADHLDDLLTAGLEAIPAPWPDTETPRVTGTWMAVGAELTTVAWTVWALARTAAVEPIDGWRGWWGRRSVHTLAAPLAWAPLAAAGCWVIAMAVEDAVAPLWADAAAGAGWAVAAIVAWRLAASGWWELVQRTPPPSSWRDGWLGAVVVLPMAGLALRYGLPYHGLWASWSTP